MNVLILLCEILVIFFTIWTFIGEESSDEKTHLYKTNAALIITIIVMMTINFTAICYSCTSFIQMLTCGGGSTSSSTTSGVNQATIDQAKEAIRSYRRTKNPNYSSGFFGNDVDLNNLSNEEKAIFRGNLSSYPQLAEAAITLIYQNKQKQIDLETQQQIQRIKGIPVIIEQPAPVKPSAPSPPKRPPPQPPKRLSPQDDDDDE